MLYSRTLWVVHFEHGSVYMAVYTRPCPASLSLPPSFPLATVISPTNHPELLGSPRRVCGVSFLWAHLAVPNSWNALPCVLLWPSPTPLHSSDSSQGTPPPGSLFRSPLRALESIRYSFFLVLQGTPPCLSPRTLCECYQRSYS